jgi:ribosomal-protein-alanine N-acetyltransferase
MPRAMADQVLAVTLQSPRSALRPAHINDLPCLVKAISHPAFPAALPLSDVLRDGELASWLNRACQRNSTSHSAVWAIDLLSGEPSVGQVSVIARDHDHMLSFWLSPDHWGKGIAREAVSTVLRYLLSVGRVTHLWAATALWNEPSARLMLALAFVEGPVIENGYIAAGASQAVRQFTLHFSRSAANAPCEA